MGFHKFKQTQVGDESHDNKQRQNISQNEIELDSVEKTSGTQKVTKFDKAFLGCVECSAEYSSIIAIGHSTHLLRE